MKTNKTNRNFRTARRVTNAHPMDRVINTVRRTVDYAVVNPGTFVPGTGSFAFYEKMSSICTTGLEHFDDMASARPLLEILRQFARTGHPEPCCLYGSYLNKEDKPWFSPVEAATMLDAAVRGIEADPANPLAPHILCIYGVSLLEDRPGRPRDAVRAREYVVRAAEGGSSQARRFLPLLDAMEAERKKENEA